ncbi:MAG: Polysulfide reductase, NrfD [Acidobacteria bacterium]|nr:Polysulfide reductase, NrfD [Acidobacteriota bacterium]
MIKKILNPRSWGFWMPIGVALTLTLGVIALIRFTRGLGAVTNLTDTFPWGLWIGFDMLCGIGLAAGGFAIAATVHVLHLEDFKPILRPTILTAFLGYLFAILALLMDLGKPWNIWHPIIMWNPHSVMFEVGWCVMLYTTVLFLEFSPVVLERFGLSTPLKIMRKLTPILVILGVILSTLHQSSLGSLFLIIPGKLHPFWYSPILPVLFFVSALTVGLAMVVVESWFSRRAFGKPLETHLLQRVSRASVVVLAIFLALRLRDLALRDTINQFLAFERYSWYLLAELGLGVALPMVLLASERFRRSPRRLAAAQGLVVLGFVFNRLNVSVTAFEAATGQTYVPAVAEFLVSMGLVALGMILFMAACQWLPVFPEGPVAEVEKSGGFAAIAGHTPAAVGDAATTSR